MRARIDAFLNRPIYRSLDAEILGSIEDARLEQAIVDFVVEHAKARGVEVAAMLAELNPAFGHVFATWITEAEVFNGGFNQFFFNSSGALAERSAAGYAAIGAPGRQGIVREAMRRLEEHADELSPFWSERTLEAFADSYDMEIFAELDTAFYALDSVEDASRLRVAYIRAHPEALTGP